MEKNLNLWIDVLEFLSFWMVAPELLGESRMRVIEKQFMKLEILLPGLIFGLTGVVTGLAFSKFSKHVGHWDFWNMFVVGFMVVYLAFILVFLKRIADFMSNRVIAPFFRRLSENGMFRAQLLRTGAVLFTLCFLLKLVVHSYFP